MRSDVPQGLVLGLMLFNIFVSDTESRTERTLGKFADDIKLCVVGVVSRLKGREAIRRDLERLQIKVQRLKKNSKSLYD